MDPRIERSRNAILASAQEILYGEGWDAVTQERVAARAEVSRSTVYRHWPDRAVLLADTIDLTGVTMHQEPTDDLRADLVGELVRFRTIVSEPSQRRVFAALVHNAQVDSDIDRVRARIVKQHTEPIRTAVADGVARGELDPSTNPEDAVAALFGPICFEVLLARRRVTNAFIERNVDRFISASATFAPTRQEK